MENFTNDSFTTSDVEQNWSFNQKIEHRYKTRVATLVYSNNDCIVTKSLSLDTCTCVISSFGDVIYTIPDPNDDIPNNDISDDNTKNPVFLREIIPMAKLTSPYIVLYDGELTADWSNNTDDILDFVGFNPQSDKVLDESFSFDRGLILVSEKVGSATGIMYVVKENDGRFLELTETFDSGYNCNGCDEGIMIDGKRYHCTVCDDFDLCEPCYKKDTHNSTHAFEHFDALLGNEII